MEKSKIIKNTTNNFFFRGGEDMKELKTNKNSIHYMSLKEGDIIFVRTGDGKKHMYELKGGLLSMVPETQPGSGDSEDSTERQQLYPTTISEFISLSLPKRCYPLEWVVSIKKTKERNLCLYI